MFKKGQTHMVEWVDLGEEMEYMNAIRHGKIVKEIATSVLQVSCLGHTGFRFPVAHYLTIGVTAGQMHTVL